MNNWKPFKYEYMGAIPNKVWVTDGENIALFKPDSEKNESIIEYETYRLAESLDIPCAKTERVNMFGVEGTLSHNFKTDPGIIYCPADSLYIKSGGFTYESKDTNENSLGRLSKLSMEAVKEMPSVEDSVVKMLFLDCLVSNRDRHGNNWELMMNKEAEVIGLAPLFDHGMSFENSFSADFDYCMVPWADGEMELKHFDMFEKLSREYPDNIEGLLLKCSEVELNDFAAGRFAVMKEIYERVNNKKIETPVKNTGKTNSSNVKANTTGVSDYIPRIKTVPITRLAEDYGLTVVRKTNKYLSIKEHDSVIIDTEKNCFWRNSVFTGKGSGGAGSCIDFAMEFGGYTTAKDAIRGISEAYGIERSKNGAIPSPRLPVPRADTKTAEDINKKVVKELALPPMGKDSKAIFGYLVNERKIDLDVVRYMHAKKMLYEDDKKNCVFVSNKFACVRGTSTKNRFVGDIAGSDYNECFYMRCRSDNKTLVVSESVIDSMSLMSHFKNTGEKYTNYNYLALCGTNKLQALFNHLERDKNIDKVLLAFDNDEGGLNALEAAKEELKNRGYNGIVVEFLPPQGKDWNEFHVNNFSD